MIAVLTHHWAKPGMFEEARALLDGNGRAQANSPGFVSRTTVLSMTDPTQITSFVVWESAEIYDQWKASPERKVRWPEPKSFGRSRRCPSAFT